MNYSQSQQKLLRKLPKVDELMQLLPDDIPRSVRLRACREAVAELRAGILSSPAPAPDLVSEVSAAGLAREKTEALLRPSLRPLVNATGVVIHTNLGRSLLPSAILPNLTEIAGRYSNLEYNLEQGVRGSRYSHVEDLLCELTGAEAALVVNNNAAAVLITLETMAKGKEVVVSRGELVEIGGSFRIPDVMARSGAILREVGATNRTHLWDYENALNEETALLLKVHQSNFQVVGFTKAVTGSELCELGKRHDLPVFEDLGSGTFIDFSNYGMIHEPTVQETVAAGVDIVSFSGDKLLGGPQAGIIVGRREYVDRIKKNPLNRALRIDKLTLAGLEGILRLYRDPEEAVRTIPTLSMMTAGGDETKRRAQRLRRRLSALGLPGLSVRVVETVSRVGGGALPLQPLNSHAVSLAPEDERLSAARLEEALRKHDPPVIVRIESDSLLMDARTILEDDLRIIPEALRTAFQTAVRTGGRDAEAGRC